MKDNMTDRTKIRKTRARRVAAAVLVFFVGVMLFLSYIGLFNGNIRVVVPGKVYRSAQLTGEGILSQTAAWSGATLDHVLTTRHIRTVINLRGDSPDSAWYRSELADCARRGVAHVDVSMSAIHLPAPEQLDKLLATFDTAAYPILFHCQGGADRSGLTGAIYLNLYEKVPIAAAELSQLSWRYGHMGFTRTRAMDKFFDLYRRTGNGMGLREWIDAKYPALYAQYEPDAKTMAPVQRKSENVPQKLEQPRNGSALKVGG